MYADPMELAKSKPWYEEDVTTKENIWVARTEFTPAFDGYAVAFDCEMAVFKFKKEAEFVVWSLAMEQPGKHIMQTIAEYETDIAKASDHFTEECKRIIDQRRRKGD